jgi:hypothetical protein
MDNPEKLQTKRTQDEDKQNVHTTDKTDSYDLNEILSYTKLRNLRLIHL